jgi:hypothetical protein
MKKLAIVALAIALASALALEASARARRAEGGPKLAHMVFFKLKDSSKEAVEKFVASAEKCLGKHEGTVYFSVGTRADDVDEPVSAKDWDVALHLVFSSKEGKLKYLKDPRHDQFVEENRAQFDKVRVYDSYLVKE